MFNFKTLKYTADSKCRYVYCYRRRDISQEY